MKKEQLKKVVDFYENVICQQIIKPQEIQEIYELVEPNPQLVPYHKKMRAISLYVQGLQKQVIADLDELMQDFDEQQEELSAVDDPRSKDYIPKDSAASPSVPDDTQSHSENSLDGDTQEDNEDPTYVKVSQPLDGESELQKLQRQYEKAETANEKRSLSAKIRHLKKKL